jgi:hypothetical protein
MKINELAVNSNYNDRHRRGATRDELLQSQPVESCSWHTGLIILAEFDTGDVNDCKPYGENSSGASFDCTSADRLTAHVAAPGPARAITWCTPGERHRT